MVLFRAKLFEESLEAFLQSNNWEMYINVCIKLNINGTQFLEKLNVLVEKLKNDKRFLECSIIYEKYLNDPENSIICLIEGSYWQQAITSVIDLLLLYLILDD